MEIYNSQLSVTECQVPKDKPGKVDIRKLSDADEVVVMVAVRESTLKNIERIKANHEIGTAVSAVRVAIRSAAKSAKNLPPEVQPSLSEYMKIGEPHRDKLGRASDRT